jgi:hypothetical protein
VLGQEREGERTGETGVVTGRVGESSSLQKTGQLNLPIMVLVSMADLLSDGSGCGPREVWTGRRDVVSG